MRKVVVAIAAIALTSAGMANATITIGSVTPGTDPYTGPAPTFDFNTPGTTPTTSCPSCVISTGTSSGLYAQPFGSDGGYFSTGPSTTSPTYIDLTSFGDIDSLSLLWGSVDDYNTIYFYDSSFNLLGSFGGSSIYNPANGDQTDPNTNPVVTFNLDGGDQSAFSYLGFTSGSNAFEIDNIHISSAVPEPGTWALMLFGFGGIGFSMRRRRALPKPAQLA